MKSFLIALLIAACPMAILAQTSPKKAPSKAPQKAPQQAPLPPHPNAPATQEIETETIGPQGQVPGVPSAQNTSTGYMEPAQVKALTHKIWLAEYRLNDLLGQVHTDKWKMAPDARKSFDQSMDSLHKSLEGQEGWRAQFEARPDSLYLGFLTYVAISAVLPRIDGLAHSVAKYENASYGAQFSQSANQLFDLQQAIEPHLAYLLKNQDNIMLAAQNNLASCQNELNFAEHNKEGRATPMKNIVPEFKGRKHTTHPAGAAKSEPAVKSGPKSGTSSSHKSSRQTHPKTSQPQPTPAKP